jgi:hypothetical protein
MRLRRLCLAIFALRLFLREPIQVFQIREPAFNHLICHVAITSLIRRFARTRCFHKVKVSRAPASGWHRAVRSFELSGLPSFLEAVGTIQAFSNLNRAMQNFAGRSAFALAKIGVALFKRTNRLVPLVHVRKHENRKTVGSEPMFFIFSE